MQTRTEITNRSRAHQQQRTQLKQPKEAACSKLCKQRHTQFYNKQTGAHIGETTQLKDITLITQLNGL